MACSSCGGWNFNVSGSCNCNKFPDEDKKIPMDTIRNGDDNFCLNDINNEICGNLKVNNGIHPYKGKHHDNCEDLHALNQYYSADIWNDLNGLDFCNPKDIRCFLGKMINHNFNLNEAEICSMCGLWDIIEKMTKNGYMTVIQNKTFTVDVKKFVSTNNAVTPIYWSGSPDLGESFISIPIEDMDIVDNVIAQPQVVGGRVHPVTVAIQSAVRQGNNYIVNFDTYEIKGNPADVSYPFSVPISFVVFGKKKIPGLD